MKLKVLTFIFGLSFCLYLLSGCKKTPLPPAPDVGVVTASFFSAKVGAAVSGLNILDKGICWGTDENPNLDGDHISMGGGSESFQTMIPDLNSQTKYHIRSFVTNEAGTVYSKNVTFTTAAAVGLTTSIVSAIASNSALCGGAIGTSTSFTPTEKGVCWSTSPGPRTSNSKAVTTNSTGSNYVASLTNLSANTVYYVRAYASSSIGTVYGNEINFRTFGEQVADIDGNKYNTITIGTQMWMIENLKVTRYRNGDPIAYVSTDNNNWASNSLDAYGYYNNSTNNYTRYGNLYNSLVISDTRAVCPTGWHIPSKQEWQTLITFLGEGASAANKLMSETPGDWPFIGTITNESRFKALPGGLRDNNGTDLGLGNSAYFWTTTQTSSAVQVANINVSGTANVLFTSVNSKYGCNIRCVKD